MVINLPNGKTSAFQIYIANCACHITIYLIEIFQCSLYSFIFAIHFLKLTMLTDFRNRSCIFPIVIVYNTIQKFDIYLKKKNSQKNYAHQDSIYLIKNK